MGQIEDWLDNLAGRNLSPNTLATYARTMRTFPEADGATVEQAEAWWQTRRKLSPATRANELAAVRSFFRWQMRHDRRSDDPTRRIDAPKIPRGMPHPLSRADMDTLLDELEGAERRALCLGAYAGLRIAEASVLDWRDIDREMNRIRVHGKGAKERLVALHPILLDQLLPDTGGNVVMAGERPLSPNALQRRVNRAIHDAGIDLTYHAARHRFGTQALAGTDNLLAVSRAMGHSKPETTAIYAAATDSDLDLIAAAVVR